MQTKLPTHVQGWHSGNLVKDVIVSDFTNNSFSGACHWCIHFTISYSRGRDDQEGEDLNNEELQCDENSD